MRIRISQVSHRELCVDQNSSAIWRSENRSLRKICLLALGGGIGKVSGQEFTGPVAEDMKRMAGGQSVTGVTPDCGVRSG